MHGLRRLACALLSGLLVVALVVGASAYMFVRRSFPMFDGVLQVSGLQDRVEVLRDRWGVPHIYASNEHDLYLAQG